MGYIIFRRNGGYWKNPSLKELMTNINNSENGVKIKWEELIKLSEKFTPIVEGAFIGCKNRKSLSLFERDNEMISPCDIFIMNCDRCWLEVSSNGEKVIKNFLDSFKEVTIINY